MIKKISIAGFTFFLFIAVFLYSLGVRQAKVGTYFMSFLNQTNIEVTKLNLVIPSISLIEAEDFVLPTWLQWLDFLRVTLNALISLVNFVIPILNFLAQSVVYFFIVIKNIKSMIDAIVKDIQSSNTLSAILLLY